MIQPPSDDRSITRSALGRLSRRRLLTRTVATAGSFALPTVHRRSARAQDVEAIPAGHALVASPRLALSAIGEAEATAVLDGRDTDWELVGNPAPVPVELVALEGSAAPPAAPARRFSTYDELANHLWRTTGAVAIVPVELVDPRVKSLTVGGFEPVRATEIDGQRPIRLGFVGDIVPGRNVHNKMVAYGDFSHPFRKIAAVLRAYQATFANLEGNLSSAIAPPADAHTFSFVSDPAMIDGLAMAGIDAVSLANNHSRWNSEGWGDRALLDTIDALDRSGMGRFGAGRTLEEARAPWVGSIGDVRVAVIGIDGVTANELERPDGATVYLTAAGQPDYAGATADRPGTNPYALETVLADIEFLAGQYDVVIPYFHMGVEYIAVPPGWAIQGARAAIDVGATIVVSNHPHVAHGMEIYQGRPIVYSLGNFIFDQMFAVEVRQGLILEIVIRGGTVVQVGFTGVEIEDFQQPRLMTIGEHGSQMDRFWWSTDRIAQLAGTS